MLNILVLSETTISLKEGSKLAGRPTRRQLYRWSREGVLTPTGERVHLERAKHGGSIVTSIEAFERFIAKCNGTVAACDRKETTDAH